MIRWLKKTIASPSADASVPADDQKKHRQGKPATEKAEKNRASDSGSQQTPTVEKRPRPVGPDSDAGEKKSVSGTEGPTPVHARNSASSALESQAEAPKTKPQPGEESRLRVVKRPQNMRSDHRNLYRELLQGMYDAVLITDPKGHVIDSNERVAEMLRYQTADMWDMPIEDVVRGTTLQMLEKLRRNLNNHHHILLDANCRRRDGTVFPAEVAISRFHLINEGDFVFYIRNVERRRKAMQKLRSQQNLVTNATTAFATLDLQGGITLVNPALCEMWSAKQDADLVDRNVRLLFQNHAALEKAMEKAMVGDRWIGPLAAQGLQGRRFTVEAMFAPDRDPRGEIVGIVSGFIEVLGVE